MVKFGGPRLAISLLSAVVLNKGPWGLLSVL